MKNKSGKIKALSATGAQPDPERKQVEDALRTCLTKLVEYQRMLHFGNWGVNLETGAFTWSDPGRLKRLSMRIRTAREHCLSGEPEGEKR